MTRVFWISALTLLMSVIATATRSADLTVNFNGQFVAPSCTYSLQGGATSLDLGTYPDTYFAANTATPLVNTIFVSTCPAGITMIHPTFFAAADSSNNQLFAVNAASTVKGVGIEMFMNVTQRIVPNQAFDLPGFNPGQQINYINLGAHFSKTTGAVTPGTVNVPIVVNFTYN
jgi:type 1 fimbria pilin